VSEDLLASAKETLARANREWQAAFEEHSRLLGGDSAGIRASIQRRAAARTAKQDAKQAVRAEIRRRAGCYEPMLAALEVAKLVLERRHPNPVNQANAANDAKRWESEAAAAQTQVQDAIVAARSEPDRE